MTSDTFAAPLDATFVRSCEPKQANAYTSSTWWYDLRGFGILTLSYRNSLRSHISFFEQNVKSRHLEVAVGTGTLFSMVLKRRLKRDPRRPEKITGIDYSPEMLGGAKRKFRKHPDVSLQHGDATQMTFADGAFDSVNIANALHCFADVPAALREIHRVLAPGGTLAVNALLYPECANGGRVSRGIAKAINRWGMRKGILHSPFWADSVCAQLFDAGFRIQKSYTEGNCLFVLAGK